MRAYWQTLVRALISLGDYFPLKVTQKQAIQVHTDLGELPNVLSWFDRFQYPLVPYSTWLQCQLALAEGFTNAVRHAHRSQPSETLIDIEVCVLDHAVEIRIWDHGPGFDLDQTVDQMPLEVDQDSEGGRGLQLMKRLADRLSYKRGDDQRNCLLVVKYYSETDD